MQQGEENADKTHETLPGQAPARLYRHVQPWHGPGNNNWKPVRDDHESSLPQAYKSNKASNTLEIDFASISYNHWMI